MDATRLAAIRRELSIHPVTASHTQECHELCDALEAAQAELESNRTEFHELVKGAVVLVDLRAERDRLQAELGSVLAQVAALKDALAEVLDTWASPRPLIPVLDSARALLVSFDTPQEQR